MQLWKNHFIAMKTTAELRVKLEQLGYSVSEDKSWIVVRLPLFCSVRISHNSQTFLFDPRFGIAGRSTATWMLFILAFLMLLSFLLIPDLLVLLTEKRSALPFLTLPGLRIFIVCGFILAFIWDIYRYILTEQFITRAQHLVTKENHTA